MSNKLSLMVNFVGIDRMSDSLRSIMRLGNRGARSLAELRGEGRRLEAQLRDVRREIDGASGNVSGLIDQERRLERQIESTNAELAERRRLNAIEGDRRAMAARGDAMMARGRENMQQGAALAAPLVLAVAAAADFSSGMVDIQQKAALTNAETDQLARNIQLMARSAHQMPEDVRAGLDLLMARGMGLDEATAAIGPASRLATAYRVDIPDAAAAAYASINNLNVASLDAGRALDVMAASGNQGGFEVRDMARHFPALTAQMSALGEEGVPAVADLSAALQVAMHTAGGADQAANNIQNLMAKINAPATVRAFQRNFGVDLPAALAELEEQGYSSLEAIAMITEEATGGDLSRLGYAFEDMQARQGIMALMQNIDEYRQIRDAAMNSEGTVDAAFDQRAARDATVQWNAFKTSVSTLAITLGTTLLPVANEALGMISGLAQRVSDWAARNPEAAATITKIVAGLAVFKLGLGAAQLAIGALFGPLATGIAWFRRMGVTKIWLLRKFVMFRSGLATVASVATRAFGAIRLAAMFLARGLLRAGAMMLANPVVLVITLIVAAIAGAAYLIYTHWDSIKAAFWQGVQAVGGAVTWVKDRLTAAFSFWAGLHTRAAQIGGQIIAGLARGIRNAASAVWNALKNVVMAGINNVREFLGIASPSRVFMAIGTDTGEGLAIGLDRQRRRVGDAAGRLAGSALAAGSLALGAPALASPQPLPAAASSSPIGGGSITIKIYQRDGESGQDLAVRVADELERRQARAARRSYEDGIA
ncbi:phage tail tape measure protein [Erythrobacter sp. EC-HK427]|uniref:phage tail tape measure protein n=1 Tax=Erythrobacter sp. EC-HK427 TaxID=2038396 RepID=UPI0012593E2D|nr:phage tail tape measure protein [Erythrobacter sp. EC-HK427]VVT07276.1 conserved membrane hypothetical protein [Erythrobacter sp. EC-HK427]